MKKEIIHMLSDYIAVYERYKDSLGHKSLIKKLTRIHNELLGIAEKNAKDFNDFKKECTQKNIFNRFDKVIKKCKKEFEKHI